MFSDRYTMGDKLGEGGQAAVYKAVHDASKQCVAVKVYEKHADTPGDDNFEDLSTEIKLLRQLKHQHIVTLLDVVSEESHIYVVQELLSGGELFDFQLTNGMLEEEQALQIFAQLCLAVDYLHGLSVAHRDIKAENIVFVERGSLVMKLIDFGTADTVTADQPLTGLVRSYAVARTSVCAFMTPSESRSPQIGTPQYMAPEIIAGWFTSEDDGLAESSEPYGLACDIWSMGVLLHEMLSFMMPFRAADLGPLLATVLRGDFKISPRIKSADACDLIMRLLVVDPCHRLPITRIKTHPWVSAEVARQEQMLPCSSVPTEAMPKRTPTLPIGARPSRVSPSSWHEPSSPSSPDSASSPRSPERHGSTPLLLRKLPSRGRLDAVALRKLALRAKASRGQQYWFAGAIISPPSNFKKRGGVQVWPGLLTRHLTPLPSPRDPLRRPHAV